jgi:glycosyltransferase involved in cell wall biosynthesis
MLNSGESSYRAGGESVAEFTRIQSARDECLRKNQSPPQLDDRMSISNESGNRANGPHRIALCITELDVGGAERFLVELATRLNRNLFKPTVYCLGPQPHGSGAELVARLSAAEVPLRFFDACGIGDAFRVLRRLRNEFDRQRPALVQTFLWHANVLGTLAARGLVSSENDQRRVPIITGLRVAEPRRRWRRPIERWVGRWTERHVAVSEGVARFARERIGLAADKIVVIPNGVDVERFPAPAIDPRSLGVRQGRRFLLFVGRLDRQDQKGASQFIEYAPMLLNKIEEHDLVFVGDGPPSKALRRRTAQLGLHDRVHWLGWRGDLPAILAAADLLIAPSHWEGMSNVVLEAMASGKPVVAQAAEGISELLADRPEQSVAIDDWLGFIERIVVVAGDKTLQLRLGKLNRERAESHFRLVEIIARYERLYADVIEASQRLFGSKTQETKNNHK